MPVVPKRINRVVLGCRLVLATAVSVALPAYAAESFRKLNDTEIKAKLAGMEVTDGVHWAEQYMRDGAYKAFHMGMANSGKWNVRNGQLCIEEANKEPGCKEVWLSGTKVEFRQADSQMPGMEGILQKQQSRK